MVTIAEFSSVDIRLGKIIEVNDLEAARKPMYVMKVDLGELGTRSIVAGLKSYYAKEELLGKTVVFVANLEPKMIAGALSEGMVLAADDGTNVTLLTPDRELPPGSRIR